MSIFKVEVETENGWTKWIQPNHKRYRMMCCDCGLVHTMQFRVVRNTGRSKFCSPTDKVPGLVVFRVQRDNRATANVRRAKKT